MIVFELVCPKHHRFEGWFASAEDFSGQKSRGLLACPTCGHTSINKLLTAKVGKGSGKDESAPAPEAAKPGAETASRALAQLSPQKLNELINYVLQNTEDVGSSFATEARKIHNEEAPKRDIRGVATKEETEELIDEGVPIMPLPIPPKGDFH